MEKKKFIFNYVFSFEIHFPRKKKNTQKSFGTLAEKHTQLLTTKWLAWVSYLEPHSWGRTHCHTDTGVCRRSPCQICRTEDTSSSPPLPQVFLDMTLQRHPHAYLSLQIIRTPLMGLCGAKPQTLRPIKRFSFQVRLCFLFEGKHIQCGWLGKRFPAGSPDEYVIWMAGFVTLWYSTINLVFFFIKKYLFVHYNHSCIKKKKISMQHHFQNRHRSLLTLFSSYKLHHKPNLLFAKRCKGILHSIMQVSWICIIL